MSQASADKNSSSLGYDPAYDLTLQAIWQKDLACYQQRKTCKTWRERSKGAKPLPPIPFTLPPDKNYGFYAGNLYKVIKGFAYINDKRLYFRTALFLTERAQVLMLIYFFALFPLIGIPFTYFTTHLWSWTLGAIIVLGLIPGLWGVRAYFKAPPTPQVISLHVLDRETGKFYVADLPNQPHVVYDFFRCYFYIENLSDGIDKPLYYLRVKAGAETLMSNREFGYIADVNLFDGGFPNPEAALKAFHAMVWYMSREEMTERDYRFLENFEKDFREKMIQTAQERKQTGDKTKRRYFQGIFHPDGRIEGVGPITHYLQNDIVTDDANLQRKSDAAWAAYFKAHPDASLEEKRGVPVGEALKNIKAVKSDTVNQKLTQQA